MVAGCWAPRDGDGVWVVVEGMREEGNADEGCGAQERAMECRESRLCVAPRATLWLGALCLVGGSLWKGESKAGLDS